jgi:hypothetical protein
MPESVALVEREGYLEARLTGSYALERFKRQIAFILQACKDRGFNRLLTDVVDLTDFAVISTFDRFEIATHAAAIGKNLIAVAMVGLPNQFDPERFGAQVAQNRGMKVRMFTDPKAALDWLTSPDGKPEG